MLHIIPNRKLHTISFQMAYNLGVCKVGQLKSTKISFGYSTKTIYTSILDLLEYIKNFFIFYFLCYQGNVSAIMDLVF